MATRLFPATEVRIWARSVDEAVHDLATDYGLTVDADDGELLDELPIGAYLPFRFDLNADNEA
jgi:hypothetical protein